MKTAVIRVDSSTQIGYGHLSRCLNLAEELRKENINVLFICCALPGSGVDLIKEKNFQLHCLSNQSKKNCVGLTWQTDAQLVEEFLKKNNPIDYLIVDHYGLDKNWEKAVRFLTKTVIVIDDLANRQHDCDLLLDQNFYPDQKIKYKHLLPPSCIQMYGPKYGLLKSDFYYHREKLRDRDGNVKRILISFGGSDVANETSNAIKACMQLNNSNRLIDVIVGSANPHRELLRKQCEALPNINYYCQIKNMAEFMEVADLSIGGGGVMNWERCCLGLPSLIITTASNQVDIAKHMASYGAIKYIGNSGAISVDQLYEEISNCLNNPDELRLMGHLGKELVDGYGCQRVVEKIIQIGV